LLSSASAERIEYCDSIPEGLVDWNSGATLPKFDPAMGTLKEVEISCIMNLSQEIKLENQNSKPGNFTLTLWGGMNVDLPSNQSLSINVNHSSHSNISGYDGIIDYSGSSGINSTEIIPTDVASMNISNIDDFLAVSPGENLTLPVNVHISSHAEVPGSVSYGVALNAGAQVCLAYTYDPKSIQEGGK
jgi:hypothetical protein